MKKGVITSLVIPAVAVVATALLLLTSMAAVSDTSSQEEEENPTTTLSAEIDQLLQLDQSLEASAALAYGILAGEVTLPEAAQIYEGKTV